MSEEQKTYITIDKDSVKELSVDALTLAKAAMLQGIDAINRSEPSIKADPDTTEEDVNDLNEAREELYLELGNTQLAIDTIDDKLADLA